MENEERKMEEVDAGSRRGWKARSWLGGSWVNRDGCTLQWIRVGGSALKMQGPQDTQILHVRIYKCISLSITGIIAAEGVLDVGHATTPEACGCELATSATIHE